MHALQLKKVLNLNNSFYVRTVTAATSSKTGSRVKSWKEIPGPSSLPLIGQLHHFVPGGKLHKMMGQDFWDLMYKSYGPLVRIDTPFYRNIVLLMDVDVMAHIYHSENNMPRRRALPSLEYFRKQYNKTKDQVPKRTGLLTEDGKNWKELRSKLNPIFLHRNMLEIYSNTVDAVSRDMITRLRSLRDDNFVIRANFDDEMKLWALEAMYGMALGSRLNCFDNDLAKNSFAKKLIDTYAEGLNAAEKLDFYPSLWKYYPTKTFKTAMKNYETIDTLIQMVIDEHKKKLKTDEKSNEVKGAIEKFFEIDEETALITAGDMIGGGINSVANAMIALLYLLATNPEKQEKLREAITLKQEKSYLKACIKEAFRLFSPVVLNLRQTTKEYTVLGYNIPKDMNIIFCHQYACLMEDQYPRAHEYIPERWVVDQTHPLYHGNANPFAYAPFGFGVRKCIGYRIVEMEMAVFLSRLVENFRIEWQGPPPKTEFSLIRHIRGPFGFIFKDV